MMELRKNFTNLIDTIANLLFNKQITPENGLLLISKIMEFTPLLDKYEPNEDKKYSSVADIYSKEFHDFEVHENA